MFKKNKYFYSTGKRKKSIAKIFLKKGIGKILINNKLPYEYFFLRKKLLIALKPLKIIKNNKFDILIFVKGGGYTGQSEAILHGLSKCLVNFNKYYKNIFSNLKFLTRDSRMVERKKLGHKKARKSKQFSKR
ncbi:putative 30S ribosomal subunit protein S9 [Candidatus Zinderia insecticola CARI]|uniref:Small ribosomal subunit protein uS9 n=1 Tax=Zinderia insecticola (strain CARI) TaxID=871271 RepID=E0TIQ9_ZINIC|nr:putative 30S ribosomal subunit protein S9 [Candidatus Zinderia insecticola CARI]